MSSNAKLEKTLKRFQGRIASGDYYEAHQTLRTIANRFVRAKSYQDAIELIAEGALSFLKVKKGGSGTDLIFYLLEVYDVAEVKSDDTSVSRLVQLLVNVDIQEPNIKDIIVGMNNWSIKFGEYKFGDPYLHSVMGKKLLESNQYLYEAERYLLLGTHDSLGKYVTLMWDWFLQEYESNGSNSITNVGAYFSRLVLNYLFISNIAYAYEAKEKFLIEFITKFSPKYEKMDKNGFIMYLFEEHKELNYLQLLLLVCQTKNKELFASLKNFYSNESTKYSSELSFLGQEYFGIVAPKQSNFLQDMMSGLLGGGL